METRTPPSGGQKSCSFVLFRSQLVGNEMIMQMDNSAYFCILRTTFWRKILQAYPVFYTLFCQANLLRKIVAKWTRLLEVKIMLTYI